MSKKWTSEQLDQTFEDFLKESVTDSDITESQKRPKRTSVLDKLGHTPSLPSSVESSGKQWWLNDNDSFDLGNSTKSFLKSAEPKGKKIEEKPAERKNGNSSNGLTRTNSSTMDVGGQPGMETIQEDKEKEMFFKNIEENKTSTLVDYAKLNKELGDSSTTGKNSADKNADNVSFLATDSLEKRQDGVGSDAKDLKFAMTLPPNDTAEADMAELKKMLKEVGMSTFGSSIHDPGYQGDSKLLADTLKDNGTPDHQHRAVLSSTPATLENSNFKAPVYDSKLSPVHSADSDNFKHSELRGFDLSPAVSRVVPDAKKYNESGGETTEDMEKIEKLFSENVGDNKSAPNFMQAKVASPRQQKSFSGKPTSLEEPETMMSQVYSSQGSSINTMQEAGRKKKKGKHRVYSSPNRGKSNHMIGSPYSYVPSSGYGVSPVIARTESVKVASPRKKSPTHVTRPKSSPVKHTERQDDSKTKPMRAQSATTASNKTQTKNTFVLAPAFLKQARRGEVKKKTPKTKKTFHRTRSKYSYTRDDDILDTVESLAHLLHHNEKMSKQSHADEKVTVPTRDRVATRDSEVNTDHEADSKYEELQKLVLNLENEIDETRSEVNNLKSEKHSIVNELDEIKKENFVLQSKLKYTIGKLKSDSVAEKSVDKKIDHNKKKNEISLTDSEVTKLQHALAEQEALIGGYQQENERVYAQLKQAVSANKEIEKAMYEENRVLKTEILDLKEELNKLRLIQQKIPSAVAVQKEPDVPIYGEDLKSAQKMIRQLEFQLQTESGLHKKTKANLVNLSQQYEDLEKKIGSASNAHTNSSNAIKRDHDNEMQALRLKLQWYVENQTLLDQDQDKLRKQRDEINDLRNKVSEMGKVVRGKSFKDKEQKKIMDLERQVKELEKILKSRQNPSSVQALVFAAAQSKEDGAKENTSASFWEGRAQKLQSKLDECDKESAMKLRSLQQQFNKMKFEYEGEIANLKSQLHGGKVGMGEKEFGKNSSRLCQDETIKSLQTKLKVEQEDFARSKDNFEKQIEYLQLCLEDSRNKNNKKAATPVRNKEMDMKRDKQKDEIMSLSQLVVALRKENEKLKMKSATESKKQSRAGTYKEYNPETFVGDHYSNLHEDNKNMLKQIAELKLELVKEQASKQELISASEINAQKIKKEYESVLNGLQMELQANAKPVEKYQHLVTSLQNQNHALQAKINQLLLANGDLPVIQKREKILQGQIKTLVNELHSKKLKNDDSKSIAMLDQKLLVLEERYRIKEQELENAVTGRAELSVQTEILKLKKLLDLKNAQISQFRNELDSILLVLNELKAVGVVVHAPKSITALLQ